MAVEMSTEFQINRTYKHIQKQVKYLVLITIYSSTKRIQEKKAIKMLHCNRKTLKKSY